MMKKKKKKKKKRFRRERRDEPTQTLPPFLQSDVAPTIKREDVGRSDGKGLGFRV